MNTQNLQKLAERFEELKQETEARRAEFFTRVFSDHRIYNQGMLDKLEAKGPPDIMVVHPSTGQDIQKNFGEYCKVHTNEWVQKSKLYFLWRSDMSRMMRAEESADQKGIDYRQYFNNLNN